MKISSITILVCGVMVALMFLSYGLFMKWIPEMNEAAMYDSAREQYQAQADLLPKAKKRKQLAKDMLIAAAQKWQSIVVDRTPPKDSIDLTKNMYQLTVDTPKFRDQIQKAVNAQVRYGGVTVENGPSIPAPDPNASPTTLLASFYNYPTLKAPAVIFDLGTITVTGTAKQIFDNVRGWANMPHYLAVADGLRLSGTSPNLTGTYQVTIVGFIRATEVAGPLSEATAASNTSPYGGRGGAPGGIPGMGGGGGGPGFGGRGGPAGRGAGPGAGGR